MKIGLFFRSSAWLTALLLTSCSTFPTNQRRDPFKNSKIPPKRLVIFSLEGISTADVDGIPLPNLQKFKQSMLYFNSATVGHLPAIPWVSNRVVATGLLPRSLNTPDYLFRDVQGKAGKRGAVLAQENLTAAQKEKLAEAVPSIPSLLHKLGRGKLLAFGSENFASAWRGPEVEVVHHPLPTELVADKITSELNAVRGKMEDLQRTDAKNKNLSDLLADTDWRGCFISMAGLPNLQADRTVGDVMLYLERNFLLEETAVVIVSTHGYDIPIHVEGIETSYSGEGPNFKTPSYPPAFKKLLETTNLQAVAHDFFVRIWVKDAGIKALSKLSAILRNLPGVAEIYRLHHTGKVAHYIREYRHPTWVNNPPPWVKEKHGHFLESFASPQGADLVATLFEGYGYGHKERDFGGPQESIQKIPLYVWAPNLRLLPTTEVPNPKLQSEVAVSLVDVHAILATIFQSNEVLTDGSSFGVSELLIQ